MVASMLIAVVLDVARPLTGHAPIHLGISCVSWHVTLRVASTARKRVRNSFLMKKKLNILPIIAEGLDGCVGATLCGLPR